VRSRRVLPLAGLLLALAGPAAGAEPGWSRQLEHELMSPYCPGRALIECPSEKAVELRLWIQAQEQAGAPREAVEARLFEQFGEQLRQAPRAAGWGLWAYLVPVAALLAGGLVVAAFLRRGAQHGSAPQPLPARARDPELEREIDRELGAS
jgi:cytochrome c-type biogenesis protein CcmH/NrfF